MPGPLHLPDEGPGPRRGAQPAGAAHRDPARRRPPRDGTPRRDNGRHPHRGDPARRAPAHADAPPRHPDHHARVALPAPHQPGPADIRPRPVGDHRRGARRGRNQAGVASGAVARTARGGHRLPAPADRPVGHPAAPGGHRRVHGRRNAGRGGLAPASGDRRRRARRPGAGGRDRGPGGGHGRPRAPRPPELGAFGPRLPLHLAVDLPEGAGPDPVAPVDHRLRQLPEAGRAAVRGAQQPGRRRDSPRPPRLGLPRAAPANRGPPEAGRPAGGGGHLDAGARRRHGRRRPSGAHRVAHQRDVGPAAGRAGRARGGGGERGPDLPQVPGGSAGGDRGGRPHAGRGGGAHRRPPEPSGRLGPADRGGRVDGRPERRRPVRGGAPGRPLPRPGTGALRGGARHAGRALPVGAVRRAGAPAGVGPGNQHPHRPVGRPAAGGHQPRDHPRPRPIHGQPPRRKPGRRARRGDGLRVAARGRVHPRLLHLADQRHHRRPGGGGPGPRRPFRPDSLLAGRPGGAAARNRTGHRPVHPPDRRHGSRPGGRRPPGRAPSRPAGGRQPGRLPG